MGEHRKFTMVDFPERVLTVGSEDEAMAAAPPHEVRVNAYQLGDRCVSAADFHGFLRDTPDAVDHTMIDCIDPCFVVHRGDGFALRPGCGDYPMIQISFWGAAAYCNWLSRTEGHSPVYDISACGADLDRDGYRLPTEAEWEAACHAGRPMPDAANCADASAERRKLRAGEELAGNFEPGTGPVPVGSSPADAAGLYEMLGNLREWCHDRFGPYRVHRQDNPRGAARGAFRVVRGGSFIDPAAKVGPASRLAAYEDTKCEVYGFRVARPR